jgi:Family of unknown function (DUF6504)
VPELEFHFIDEPIEVLFDRPPALEKSPECPQGFLWQGNVYRVEQLLEEWRDYRRRGRMARNMQPEHAQRASLKGSWGVGRFYFRVLANGGREFELYYDRSPNSIDERKGGWYLLGERYLPDKK